MKIFLPFYIIALVALNSCKNNTYVPTAADSAKAYEDSIKKIPFYPIASYIADQIRYVDSTPLAIYKFTLINGKQVDSVIIDRPAFHELAKEFLEPDLNRQNIKPLYIENSFEDLSINTLTFNYTTHDSSQELQQADILLNPETHAVKNMMFRKNRMVKDTSVSLNGLWKNNMNFQLNYSMQPPIGPAINKQIKVVWDKPMQTDY